MDIKIKIATLQDLSFIDYLQRLNAEELSFYPKTVFEREVDNKRILLALVNNVHAGYLYHGSFRQTLKIHQACIEYDLRGQAYGSQLIRNLLGSAELMGVSSVTLRCGSDIAANGFWKAMGFYCQAVTPGGVRRMRDINNWRFDLQMPLFEIKEIPSEKQQDASLWRKRKATLKSQFLRGKSLAEYRQKIINENDT